MGCGGSKYDKEGEIVPARLRPLLHHRFEEIRRRRNVNALKNSTPSKKELLHPDDAVCEEDDNSGPTRSSSLDNDNENDDSKKKTTDVVAVVVVVKQEEKISVEAKEEDKDGKKGHEGEKGGGKVEKKEAEKKAKCAESEEGGDEDEDEDEDEGESEDEGMLSSNDEGYVCPGSPSFRVYCIESLANITNDSKNAGTHNELLQGVESFPSGKLNEGSVKKPRKKGKKGRRFGKVLPKGGQVKSLLNVKSCYTPACISHDNTRFLQKAAN